MKNIGFIGGGNMGEAMLGGILKKELVLPESIMVSDPSEQRLGTLKEKYHILISKDNKQVAAFADLLVLAVKPHLYSKVIEEIKDYIKDETVVITIAAGIPMESTERAFGRKVKVVRTMPNTPALVGEGMSALCFNSEVSEVERQEAINLFKSFGQAEVIEERLMDAVPAVSGSSPAYVFMFIEALADGAVLSGIPRDKAYRMAAQAVLGAAKMVLETGKHPGELKDNVCSPGGTTIEAVYTLEKNNFRGAVMAAMESCTNKTVEMSKKS